MHHPGRGVEQHTPREIAGKGHRVLQRQEWIRLVLMAIPAVAEFAAILGQPVGKRPSGREERGTDATRIHVVVSDVHRIPHTLV